MQKTTERLKKLEQIEKFREEKLIKELNFFEEVKKKEEEEFKKIWEKDFARQRYLDKQKERLHELKVKKIDSEINKEKEVEKKK